MPAMTHAARMYSTSAGSTSLTVTLNVASSAGIQFIAQSLDVGFSSTNLTGNVTFTLTDGTTQTVWKMRAPAGPFSKTFADKGFVFTLGDSVIASVGPTSSSSVVVDISLQLLPVRFTT